MMIHCKNCGQMNAQQSNFCRFCGRKFVSPPPPNTPLPPQRQEQIDPEPRAPKPYSWKTDEFQVKETGARPTEQINEMQRQFLGDDQKTSRLPARRNPTAMAPEYRCPNCGSGALPYATRKISSAGWIVLAALLIVFFPLFWIGLLVKEDAFICPVCSFRVG